VGAECLGRTSFVNSSRASRCERLRNRKALRCWGASRGLVGLTGGDGGPLAAALMPGGESAGRETVERFVRIGSKNVYVELQRHRERAEEWRDRAAMPSPTMERAPYGRIVPFPGK
jgi:DNA polymerase III alpha subunit